MAMIWHLSPNGSPEALGFIPSMVDDQDPRPAAEQLDSRYGHGGGWRPQAKFKMQQDGGLKYPGDPALPVIAFARLRHELIRIYPYGYVSVTQPDGSFEACRMD